MNNIPESFTPEYYFVSFVKLIVSVIFFLFMVLIFFLQQTINWQIILLIVSSGFMVVQNAKTFIKKIEFHQQEMSIRYIFWPEKSVEYQAIQHINAGFSIRGSGFVIQLQGMKNGLELHKHVAEILKINKIKNIDIDQEIENRKLIFRKSVQYGLVATFLVSIFATIIIRADFATWLFLFFVLFLMLFILIFWVLSFLSRH